jgi:hypothetical protein
MRILKMDNNKDKPLAAKDCYGINYLDDGRRIKRVSWLARALWSPCFVLQVKTKWRWKTVSWVYVESLAREDSSYIEEYLNWEYGV